MACRLTEEPVSLHDTGSSFSITIVSQGSIELFHVKSIM